jgi:ankyrin repeat protein
LSKTVPIAPFQVNFFSNISINYFCAVLSLGRSSDDYHIVRTTADAPTIHNQNKWTLFHVAAAFNHLQCAKILLESGGKAVLRKTSHNGSTPLHLAANAGKKNYVHILIHLISTQSCLYESIVLFANTTSHSGVDLLHTWFLTHVYALGALLMTSFLQGT